MTSKPTRVIALFLAVMLLGTGVLLHAGRPQPLEGSGGPASSLPGSLPLADETSAPRARPICDRNGLVDWVSGRMGYAEFTVGHSEIINTPSLLVWYVDPEWESGASEERDWSQDSSVRRRAARVVAEHVSPVACFRDLFELIEMIVVDQAYRLLFRGSILASSLPSPESPPQEAERELAAAFVDVHLGPSSRLVAGGSQTRTGSCSWRKAREGLVRGFDELPGTKAFYIVIDDEGVNVWLQWEGSNPRFVPNHFIHGVITAATRLGCLDPRADTLWLVFLDRSGREHLIGQVAGVALASGDPSEVFAALTQLYP